MTDKQQPEALRQAAWLKKEGASCQRHYDLGVLIERQHTELETLRARVQELESQVVLDCMTHVQNPAENEHVAGDVSKNGAELNMSAQQPAPATQQAGEMPESIEQLAVARYKVAPAHESMFHRWAVVAGDGEQQLYLGREVECENMARKFAGAFLDGAFAFHSMLAAAPPAQPAPQTSPASHGNVTEVLDIPDQCPYSGPSSHRDVWLAGWYAARRQARRKP